MKRFSMRLAGSGVWFGPGLIRFDRETACKRKGPRNLRNPLKSLEPAGGIEPSIKPMSNQMGR